jgi:hypothetical protein
MAEGYLLTAPQLQAALSPRSRLLILCTPSNPSGAVYPLARLQVGGRVHAGLLVGGQVLSDLLVGTNVFVFAGGAMVSLRCMHLLLVWDKRSLLFATFQSDLHEGSAGAACNGVGDGPAGGALFWLA